MALTGRRTRTRLLTLFLSLAIVMMSAAFSAAQYGHPLKGTWSGDWGPNDKVRHRVLLELNWDGKAITGTINPGPNAVRIQKATLDPSSWAVRFEAEGKTAAGATVSYLIEGQIENLGAYRRVLSGTWYQGSGRGDFKLTRN